MILSFLGIFLRFNSCINRLAIFICKILKFYMHIILCLFLYFICINIIVDNVIITRAMPGVPSSFMIWSNSSTHMSALGNLVTLKSIYINKIACLSVRYRKEEGGLKNKTKTAISCEISRGRR